MTYHKESLTQQCACHNCGEPAVVMYVADSLESSTGYQDSFPLCKDCEEEYDAENE